MNEQDSNSRRAGIEQLLQFFLETAQEAIQSGKLDTEDMSYSKRAVDAIMEHRGPLMAILGFIEKFPNLDHHILNLLLAAYDSGKSGNVTNSARMCDFKKRQSAYGLKSGKNRMNEAAETWHPKTKELAEQKLKSDPAARRAEIIRYVRDNWPLKLSLPKSDRQIDRFIFDTGTIRERLTLTG